jgi:hypothetical protein
VPIFGIRILEGKCFEELAVLCGEMEASLQFGSSFGGQRRKIYCNSFFSLKILGPFLAVSCFSVSLPNT